MEWVSQYRLPLFFKSDLFSEYKISKLLSSESVVPDRSTWKHRASINTPLETSAPTEKESSSTLNLPEISYQSISDVSTVDLELPSKPSGIPVSRSDAVLETKKGGRRVRWHRSLSVDPDVLVPPASGSESLSLSNVHPDTTRRTNSEPYERLFLCSKSDMTALWKFLKGKAGERNWLFWLDAERIKYYSSDADQQRYVLCCAIAIVADVDGVTIFRLVKDLRERYLHSGSPLELPAETSMRIKLSRSGQLTMEQIAELQDAMITKLKNYW